MFQKNRLSLEFGSKVSNTKDVQVVCEQIEKKAEEGDYAIFLKDQSIEIEYDSKKYLIVPQSAILVLIRRDAMGGLRE